MEVTVAEDIEGVAALLHEAAQTHHIVYRIVDGDDSHRTLRRQVRCVA